MRCNAYSLLKSMVVSVCPCHFALSLAVTPPRLFVMEVLVFLILKGRNGTRKERSVVCCDAGCGDARYPLP